MKQFSEMDGSHEQSGAEPLSDNEIVVVSGLPRSGTSMMMKMLNAGGIQPMTDELRKADVDNPKGYYEFERVKKLRAGDVEWLEEARGKVVKVISALLEYLPATYSYRVIFVQRNMQEVLASQKKMLAHRGEDATAGDDEAMAQMFESHLQKVYRWLEEQPSFSVLYVDYNQLLLDPEPWAQQINEFLSGALEVDRMAEVVDPKLYRNRRDAPG
jgi:hypothetical protein